MNMEGQVDIEQGKRKAAALRKESRKKIRVSSDVDVTAEGLAGILPMISTEYNFCSGTYRRT